jgi:hypothetical protein
MLSRRDSLLAILALTLALPGAAWAGGDGGGRGHGATGGKQSRRHSSSTKETDSDQKSPN